MNARRSAAAALATFLALGSFFACSPEPERVVPKTLCGGLIPGQAVVDATGTNKIKARLRERDFSADPLFVCKIVFLDVSGGNYSLVSSLSTLGYEFRNNRIPAADDAKPVVEDGRRVRIDVGSGTLSAKQAWVYATCNQTEYAINVSIGGETPGDAEAVRTIVASVLDALKKHKKGCGPPAAAAPSPSPS